MESDRKHITVTELNFYLSNIISAEELLQNIYVVGEVSRPAVKGGNLYFTLKDEGGQIAACSFNKSVYVPKEGERVLVCGTPDYYGKMGRMSFIAKKIEPFGRGDLFLQLEALKEKLRAEGLFDDSRKKPIPSHPQNVLVITSCFGAVIRDIHTTVRRYNSMINLTLYDVRVQGEHAVEDISDALLRCDPLGYDVIILARGGGSIEDLMPFNSEVLARVISLVSTPVISAIGHETDFTICDFVADERAPTPTAAAERVAYDPNPEISEKVQRMKIALIARTKREEQREKEIEGLKTRSLQAIQRKTEWAQTSLERRATNLRHQLERKISDIEGKLSLLGARLSANNPAALLQKGYAIVKKEGRTVRSAQTLKPRDSVILQFSDGERAARIVETEESK